MGYVKGTTLPFIRTCQVLARKGPAKMSNYPTPYRQKFKTTYIEYSQLLCEQESIGWDNPLCGKFSKQWRFYQNYYEACRKNANRVATARTTAKLTPAQRRKKKKRNPN